MRLSHKQVDVKQLVDLTNLLADNRRLKAQ